jgi:SNF2 family DNA or RNA helicase
MNTQISPIDQLSSALVFLSDRCDGAIEDDGKGFNGGDSNFGKSLAAQIKSGRKLTERQAAAGCRLVAKYAAQLAKGNLVAPEWAEIEPAYSAQKIEIKAKQLAAEDRRCEASPDGESILIYFDYDPRMVATIKDGFSIRKFVDAKGDAPAHWKVPMRLAAQLIELLEPLKFRISAEIYSLNLGLVAEQQERQAAKEAKAIDDAKEIQKLMELAQVDEPFGPNGYLLRDYQKDGIQYLLARTKAGVGTGAILADEMGLGKTIELLFAAKALQVSKNIPVIVICPVSLRGNWQKEAEMVGVKIETYSWQKQPQPLELLEYVLIADECHYAQNSTSARTKSLMALAKHKNCAATWLATGTPMKNGQPHNLLPLLMATGHPLGRDPWAYKQRYCNAHQKNVKGRAVWDFTGSSFLQELAQKTEDVILRRLKSAVLKDLPAKSRIMSPVELEPKVEKALQAAIEQAAADYRTRMAKAPADEREGMADAEAIVALTNARRISSEFKIPRAIEMAQELLENGEPVVIFTEFTDTAEKIHLALRNHGAELLTGATKQADRQGIVDRFQAGTSKVFVGTVKAGGVGITLTTASTLIMVDRPWTPGDAYQAEDRIHRMGQKNAAMIYWLQVSEVDRAIDQLIETKQARIELVLRGKRKTFRGLKSIKAIAKALLDLIEPDGN